MIGYWISYVFGSTNMTSAGKVELPSIAYQGIEKKKKKKGKLYVT